MKRFIDSSSTDIFFNLAAEEYLLKQQTDDVFMLWQNTPSIVLGKHQRVQSEVNIERTEHFGIPIARRFSGGGTVYHDFGNINLTFIETKKEADFTVYLQQTIQFLNSLGLKAEGDERLGIYLNGLKISGSAQCVHKNRMLYHCTLLYDTDLRILDEVLDVSPDIIPKESGYSVPSVRSEVTNIRRHLPNAPSTDTFRKILFWYFSEGEKSSPFSKEEEEAILCLRNGKYTYHDWNFSSGRKSKSI